MSKAGIMRFDATRARELLSDGTAEMTRLGRFSETELDSLLEKIARQ